MRVEFLQILVVTAIITTGCGRGARSQPQGENIKISSLAGPSKIGLGKMLTTCNFDVYVFDIPAENVDKLDLIWSRLFRHTLRYENAAAFSANSFVCGAGEILMWNEMRALLEQAKAQHVEKISLLVQEDKSVDMDIRRIAGQRNIYYFDAAKQQAQSPVKGGYMAFRIHAAKTGIGRGACNVKVMPVFRPYGGMFSSARKDTDEVSFSGAAVAMHMSPGQFLVLGPSAGVESSQTLAGLYFSPVSKTPSVRIYAIVCTAVN